MIPATNLFVSPIVQSLNGTDFDFTFTSRNSSNMISQLGETLIRLLPTIPDGTVIFFPSYSYLEHIITEWKKKKGPPQSMPSSIWTRLEALKPIFTEAQSGTATSTEDVLTAYTAAIGMTSTTTTAHKGALLLAVIGGKLSEGINFSDALGRCVIVIGLPYPNPHSPEWKARMEYIEQKAAERINNSNITPTTSSSSTTAVTTAGGSAASREFAENVCMRAVNQAIGRAVRHKGDWAAILLVDRRYGQKRIKEKLPKWIQASLSSDDAGNQQGFAAVEGGMKRFFAGKA